MFNILINQIAEDTPIYKDLTSNFNSDGVTANLYFCDEMHVPTPQSVIDRMEKAWADLTVESVNMSIANGMNGKWALLVLKAAEFFDTPKSHAQAYVRFLAGLPNVMASLSRPEAALATPSKVFPANYPPLHARAGQAHPHAGEPDIMKIAQKFDEQLSDITLFSDGT